MSAKIAYRILILLSVAVVSGCASQLSAPPRFVHPELLYLQDQPYARLYVEIDRMEGAGLPDYLVEELKAFLGKHCLKSDAIEVVLDAPIPAAEFEGVGLSSASILSIDGPVDDDSPQPAYLHLFVYDGKTMFKGAMRNPSVVSTGPSGVFWNVDYARSFSEATKIYMLRHELGHVLGLCQNTTHGDGAHCRKSGCLMYRTPDWLSQWGGMMHLYFREHRLCEDCERDLVLTRQGPPDDALSFAGPFLVRRAEGYCVASLPFYDTIIDGPTPTGFDWSKALRQAKAGVRQVRRSELKEGRDRRTGHTAVYAGLYDRPQTELCPEELERDIAVLSKAVNDPSRNVSRLAFRILKKRQDALLAQRR